MEPKKPFHEVVAENLIEQLKKGTAPWQKPWKPGENSLMPINPSSGKRYRGVNAIHLIAQGRNDSRWMTYKQAAASGYQVRKGEKGTPVQYWKFNEEQDRIDENGKPVLNAKGEKIKEVVPLERPRVFFATVFNGEQIEGLPQQQIKPKAEWDAIERAEHILQVSRAKITHVGGDRAFYKPSTDSITLPEKNQFLSADNYYATALHELGHWTGHVSRLDRDLAHPFGSEGYAREELRAEIASMILGDELGIGYDPGQHAAYVNFWIKALEDEPLEVFKAAADAEKVCAYVLAFEQKQVQEQVQEQAVPTPDISNVKYLVCNDNTLCYREEGVPTLAVLSSNIHGRNWVNGPFYIGQSDELRAATVEDFARFRVMLPSDFQQNQQQTTDLTVAEHPAGDIDSLPDSAYNGIMSQLDAKVTSALRNLRTGTEATRALDIQALNKASEAAFGFTLPDDWNGQVHFHGNVLEGEGSQHVTSAAALGVQPQFYGVYARLEDGTQQWLADFNSDQQAAELVQRLATVDAYAEVNDVERMAKLARIKQNEQKEYIKVPYKEKDEAKALGARWDRQEQSWYVPTGIDVAPFAKWVRGASDVDLRKAEVQVGDQQEPRQYLAVPYGQHKAAKAAGALWDKAAKSWYVGPQADMSKLDCWKPENVQVEQRPAMTPREEFAEAMCRAGLSTQGGHPIMDGKAHRVPVEGGKKGAVDGFYIGHLDGHPAGRIVNNKTGQDIKWKSKGYVLSSEEKVKMHAEAMTKLAQRAAEQDKRQRAAAERVGQQMTNLVPIERPTPYLQEKRIRAHVGIMTDSENLTTYVPAVDANGKQWSMQYIHEDGTKRFAKDSKKEGCFHPVGGMKALEAAPFLIISEGYATAAQVADAVGHATVAAFDSGNLEAVALALHAKFPDKPVIIAGDDDRHLVMTHGNNPGRDKAEAAAKAVGGKAIFPTFAPSEIYPAVPAITPDNFKAHLRAEQRLAAAAVGQLNLTDDEVAKLKALMLSDVQLSALSTMKRCTDFNDLAHKSTLGIEGLKRQIGAAVSQVQREEKIKKKQKIEQHQKRAARL